ncbi:MAG: SdpI family protein [Gammaproteobacteria bacterium]|nr:SdpI family protein [Gammaproteobacteria bacterium]MDH4313746.1 SdpI family protein [Gammaproteobacteria bacterium]MDH5213466.1 SdpI family protein [Gammaproteobacteria bacterium]MDH5500252.1 SdpI family protein [Gammaproteobacteria bacterium]
MNRTVADILSLLLIAATITLTLIFYADLPDPMPTHWNAAGEVDGYMPKPWGVIALPFAAIFVFLLMKFVAHVLRRKPGGDEAGPVLSLFQLVMVAFMSGVAALVLFEAKGYDTGMDRLIPGGVGVLFLVIGHSFGKVRRNKFMGIRTPWTLANDEVWDRTHRLGSKLFMLAGLLLLAYASTGVYLGWTLVAVFALLLFSLPYSYFVHRSARNNAD